jgi:copper(I)-binding protein
MYLSMTNETPAADTLTKVVTPAAASAELHRDRGEAMSHDMAGMQGAMGAGHEMAMMVPVALVPIPAGETIRFAPGGYHVMLMHPSVPARGTTVPVTLHFARAGNIQANATVITYADVDSATRPSHDHSSK